MGSPVCPGKKRKCVAGLCDEPHCRARANASLLSVGQLGSNMAALRLTKDSAAVECNNNRVPEEKLQVKNVADEKELLKAVTVAGLVGFFRQSKA
jgi:hypothetical protein